MTVRSQQDPVMANACGYCYGSDTNHARRVDSSSCHGWSMEEGQRTEAGVDGETNVGTACRVSTSVLGDELLEGRTSL